MTLDWKQIAQQKRESIISAIPSEWRINAPSVEEVKDVTGASIEQYLSPKEIEITNTDAVGIVEKAKSGTWSSLEITKAFSHRAALAHQLTNCLHEIFFDAALKDAEELDALYAQGKTRGPLHGLPVSLKDQFHVKDVETSMGYVGWIGTFQGKKNDKRFKTYESVMVQELRSLGAVLYVKTAVPHTLMCGETVNNIIGWTMNPKNRMLSSGGSSGGEGALIGAHGSPVGLGTDIGGSIRIPAAFNGLFGLRPSSGRLAYEGMANSLDGQNTILSVVGPLGTSIGGVKLITQALLSTSPWLEDPMVHEIPWRLEQEKLPSKLCFGVMYDDGQVSVAPPIKRAIDMTVAALKKQGHEIVEWTPPSHKDINDCTFKTWVYDGALDLFESFKLSGEPPAEQLAGAFGSEPKEQFTGAMISANNVLQRELRKGYMDYWNSTASKTSTGRPVDAVIAPLAPFPAARRALYAYYGESFHKTDPTDAEQHDSYSTWVNLLDYTSVVVPVTNVDQKIDKIDETYQPRSDVDKLCYGSYDPELYDGAHVSLQLVGRRLQEERMLAVGDLVDKALKS